MIAGRYTLDREIGRGGAGIVHLARDEVLGREVAIKRIGLLPGTTDRDIERAQREARIAAGITHPHVVSILDLVKDVDCYWLVMEHVRGRTLAEVVRADGALGAERAAGILAQAADALVQANRAGIVHRDVKPSNIMVSDDDHTKLGDFGIARAASDSALTVTGEVTGSPAYLAPEVASGSPATPASDVWSLGATLYHAVEGRAPYDVGGNVMGGLYRIVHDEPPRLPADHPLAGVLARTMVKDPDERWSAEQVRDELRRIARGARTSDATTRMETVPVEPVPAAAPPVATPRAAAPPPVSRPVKSAAREPRRAPLGWIAAAAVLVLLAVLGTWLLWPGDGQQPEVVRHEHRAVGGAVGGTVLQRAVVPRAVGDRLRGADDRPQPVPERHACGGADLPAGLLLPRDLRPGVVVRDAHAGVPGGERRLRRVLRFLEHDPLGAPVRHQRGPGVADRVVHDRIRHHLGPYDDPAGAAAARPGRRRLPDRRRGLRRPAVPDRVRREGR